MKRALPDADTVKAAIDMVLEEAAANGHRPTVTAIERRLGIPHATFHRHYADLIDTHFRPHIPATIHTTAEAQSSGSDERVHPQQRRARGGALCPRTWPEADIVSLAPTDERERTRAAMEGILGGHGRTL